MDRLTSFFSSVNIRLEILANGTFDGQGACILLRVLHDWSIGGERVYVFVLQWKLLFERFDNFGIILVKKGFTSDVSFASVSSKCYG